MTQTTKHEGTADQKENFLKKHIQKIAALAFWMLLIAAYQWYAITNDLSPLQVIQNLLGFLSQGFWGPLIYILLYTFRPLILFPSTLLTLASGFVFGPVLGVLYTIVASNFSSTVAFFVGRYFGNYSKFCISGITFILGKETFSH